MPDQAIVIAKERLKAGFSTLISNSFSIAKNLHDEDCMKILVRLFSPYDLRYAAAHVISP